MQFHSGIRFPANIGMPHCSPAGPDSGARPSRLVSLQSLEARPIRGAPGRSQSRVETNHILLIFFGLIDQSACFIQMTWLCAEPALKKWIKETVASSRLSSSALGATGRNLQDLPESAERFCTVSTFASALCLSSPNSLMASLIC